MSAGASADRPMAPMFTGADLAALARWIGVPLAPKAVLPSLALALHHDLAAALHTRAAGRAALPNRPRLGRPRKQWRELLDDALQQRFREAFARSPSGGEMSRRSAVAWVRTLCTIAGQRVSAANEREAMREVIALADDTIVKYLRKAAQRRRLAQDCASLPPFISVGARLRGPAPCDLGMEADEAAMSEPALMTKAEACKLLRMSVRTFETKVVNAGRITPVRITPGKVLFRRADLIALISG